MFAKDSKSSFTQPLVNLFVNLLVKELGTHALEQAPPLRVVRRAVICVIQNPSSSKCTQNVGSNVEDVPEEDNQPS